MAEKLIDKLAEHGITGLLLAVALFVIYKLYSALERERRKTADALETAQKERLEDQKAHTLQLVDLTKTAVSAIGSGTNAAAATKESLGEVRATMRDFNDTLREHLEEFRRLTWSTKK
jgi:hypothetical protein